jgi:hypothetical protein
MKRKAFWAAICLVAFYGTYVLEAEEYIPFQYQPETFFLRLTNDQGQAGLPRLILNLNSSPTARGWSETPPWLDMVPPVLEADGPGATAGKAPARERRWPGLATAPLVLAALPLLHGFFAPIFRDFSVPGPNFDSPVFAIIGLVLMIGIVVGVIALAHGFSKKNVPPAREAKRPMLGKKSHLDVGVGQAGVAAYGTLMSQPDLERTLGHPYEGKAYPVHMRDYARGWNLRRCLNDPQAPPEKRIGATFLLDGARVPFEGMVFLNVYPENDAWLNGVLYMLGPEDLAKVDAREYGYKRTDITDKIEEYDFTGGRVYIYEGLPEPPEVAAADPGKYIIVKEYVDQVIAACDGRGREFRDEFVNSTRAATYRIVSYEKITWEKTTE